MSSLTFDFKAILSMSDPEAHTILNMQSVWDKQYPNVLVWHKRKPTWNVCVWGFIVEANWFIGLTDLSIALHLLLVLVEGFDSRELLLNSTSQIDLWILRDHYHPKFENLSHRCFPVCLISSRFFTLSLNMQWYRFIYLLFWLCSTFNSFRILQTV